MSRWKKRLSKKNVARVLAASMMLAPLVYTLPPVVAPVGKAYAEGVNHAPEVHDRFLYEEIQKSEYHDYVLFDDLNSGTLGEAFTDPDLPSDTLSPVAFSILDENVADAQFISAFVDGYGTTSVLRVTGKQAGTTTVTVTVKDSGGLTATERFVVTVKDSMLGNTPPEFVGNVSDEIMLKNSSNIIDLDDFFIDDNGLNSESITVTTNDPDVLGISTVSDSVYKRSILAKKPGDATVEVSVFDNHENALKATYYYNVTVESGELTGKNKTIYLESSESRAINLVDDPENLEDWGLFLDTDGDALEFSTPELGTTGVVTSATDGDNQLWIDGVNVGTTTVTVSASDPDSNTTNATITAHVLNSVKVSSNTLAVSGSTSDAFYLTEFYPVEDTPSLEELQIRVNNGEAKKVLIEEGTSSFFDISDMPATPRYMLYKVVSGIESVIPVEFVHIENIPNAPHVMGKDLLFEGYGKYFLAPYTNHFWTKEELYAESNMRYVSSANIGEGETARLNTRLSDNETELVPGLYVLYNIHSEGSPLKAVQFVHLIDMSDHLYEVSQIDANNGGNGIDVKDIVLYLKNSGQLDLNVLKLLIQHIGPRFAIEEEEDLGD